MAKKWQDLTDIEKSKYKKIYVVLGVILVIVFGLIIATSGGSDSGQSSEQAQSAQEASKQEDHDASATLACQHFGNVLGDIRDGILTGEEARQKLVEVNDDAKYSDDLQVRTSSKTLLAAFTSGTSDEVSTATNSLIEACTKYN